MKLIIALALIAAVAAYPESVVLPKAVIPELQEVQPITLPKAALPAFEESDIPAEPVKFVDNAEAVEESPAEPVKFVDNAEEDYLGELGRFVDNAEAVEEIPAEPVKFVDNAEEDILGELGRFVDNAEAVEEIPAEPVKFVDNAEEDILGELGRFVDNADAVEEIPAEPVRFVDNAFEHVEYRRVPQVVLPKAALPPLEDGATFEFIDISPVFVPQEVINELKLAGLFEDIPAEPVNFVDGPVDDPAPSSVRVVDVAENAPAVEQPEAPVSSIRVVDIPEFSAPREQIAPGELEAIRIAIPEFQEDGLKVNVVDAPRYPGKLFADPLLR